MALFERFWSFGYACCTADADRRPVHRADVQRWISKGERDFGYMNYLFQKTGS
jgi:hypothetical protein